MQKAKVDYQDNPKVRSANLKLDGKEKKIRTLLERAISQASIVKIIGVLSTTL